MLKRALAIGLVLSGFAGAATITASTDSNRGLYGLSFNQDGTTVPAYFVGVLSITLTVNQTNYYRDTLCVDLFTDILVNQPYRTQVLHPYQVTWRNVPELERTAWLIDNALLPTQTSILSTAIPKEDWVTTAVQGAAIQLAIWDITVDDGDGFSAGRVQSATLENTTTGGTTDASVLQWAELYETLSKNQSSNAAFVYNNFSLSDGSPAQMLEGPEFRDGGPHPNPESSTYVLLGLGLIGTAFLTRRKKSSL